MLYALLGCGVYLIVASFICTSKNTISTVLYKVIPFLIGLFLILYSVKGLGWF